MSNPEPVAKPETREILQCVYSPRAPITDKDPGSDRGTIELTGSSGTVGSVFTKQAILATAFDALPAVDSVLEAIDPGLSNREQLVKAVRALDSREPAAAAPLLASVPIQAIAEFADAAVAIAKRDFGKQAAEWDRRSALIRSLERAAAVDPIGFLHLERLHFTPVEPYRKGDLMYSVTLMPGELIRLTHREWSKTEEEFTRLVAESLENAQEEATSEKTELTESDSVQRAHSMAFTASLSVSGNYGFVSVAANAGMSLNEQTNTTREVSQKQSRESTRKASSRAKKEHKVTFRVLTSRETESTSFREIKNDSAEAVRWDFHRMMREWKVELYRYDVRLTYDVTIPEPGAYLLGLHQRLDELNRQIDAPLPEPPITQVTPENYQQLQETYGVLLDAPPEPIMQHTMATTAYPGQNDSFVANTIAMAVPDGYMIDPASVTIDEPIEAWKEWQEGNRPRHQTSITDMREQENRDRMWPGPVTRPFTWRFTVFWYEFPRDDARALAGVRYVVRPLPATINAWRAKTHAKLVDALRQRHEEQIRRLGQERDVLTQRLAADDALTLRRIEREEVMKGVLRWIFGPSFRFYPRSLADAIDPDGPYDPEGSIADDTVWKESLRYGQLISFLHQAIEWENVNFVLYPYFWSDPLRWDSKQRFRHYDSKHAEFLRAGAARIVVTIRPGFVAAWLRLAETGELALGEDDPESPYLSIANEIKAAAMTYQPHTPGVNRLDLPGLLIDEWTEWTPTGALDVQRGQPLV